MWSFRKTKKIKDFNIVIEGTHDDDWRNLNYKIARIETLEDRADIVFTDSINDGEYKYKLYGEAKDSQTIYRLVTFGGSKLSTCLLGFCEGIVLPYRGGVPNILDRPRAICTRQGIIFIEESMLKDKDYLKAIPSILNAAGDIFRDKELSNLYKKVIKS